MNSLISICIPTYHRPALLREAINSCFEQSYTDFEIVIGDDSKDDISEKLVEEYNVSHPGRIHYVRNVPSLGQAGNVNDLFSRAQGDRTVLLHDDDTLLPNALEKLAECWTRMPALSAAFGKQYITNQDGQIQMKESEELNRAYHRTPENAGMQAVPAVAGLLRMFPNDGYMVLTSLARAIGYRPRSEVGEACDTDFGVRLCVRASAIWFIDGYTAKYRISQDAITRTHVVEHFAYSSIEAADVPPGALQAKHYALQSLAPGAVSGFARLGQPGKALSILLSSRYSIRNKLHPRAVFNSYLILKGYVTGALRPDTK